MLVDIHPTNLLEYFGVPPSKELDARLHTLGMHGWMFTKSDTQLSIRLGCFAFHVMMPPPMTKEPLEFKLRVKVLMLRAEEYEKKENEKAFSAGFSFPPTGASKSMAYDKHLYANPKQLMKGLEKKTEYMTKIDPAWKHPLPNSTDLMESLKGNMEQILKIDPVEPWEDKSAVTFPPPLPLPPSIPLLEDATVLGQEAVCKHAGNVLMVVALGRNKEQGFNMGVSITDGKIQIALAGNFSKEINKDLDDLLFYAEGDTKGYRYLWMDTSPSCPPERVIGAVVFGLPGDTFHTRLTSLTVA